MKTGCYGILVGVNKSILNVSFGNGLTISYWDVDEGLKKIAKLAHQQVRYVQSQRMLVPWINRQEDRIYYIKHEIDSTLIIKLPGVRYEHQYAEYIRKIFESKITLLKIIKKSIVQVSDIYYFQKKKGIEQGIMHSHFFEYLPSAEYILDIQDWELKLIQHFLDNNEYPFANKFEINLAIDCYVNSWHKFDYKRSFIEAMMGLEALFNPGPQELTYQIKRSIAVMLGDGDVEDSIAIFDQMGNFYSKRSVFVHGLKVKKKDEITIQDLVILRDFLRKTIMKCILMDRPLEHIRKSITEAGYNTQRFVKLDIQ